MHGQARPVFLHGPSGPPEKLATPAARRLISGLVGGREAGAQQGLGYRPGSAGRHPRSALQFSRLPLPSPPPLCPPSPPPPGPLRRCRSAHQEAEEEEEREGGQAAADGVHGRAAAETQGGVPGEPLHHGAAAADPGPGAQPQRVPDQDLVPEQTCQDQESHGHQERPGAAPHGAGTVQPLHHHGPGQRRERVAARRLGPRGPAAAPAPPPGIAVAAAAARPAARRGRKNPRTGGREQQGKERERFSEWRVTFERNIFKKGERLGQVLSKNKIYSLFTV